MGMGRVQVLAEHQPPPPNGCKDRLSVNCPHPRNRDRRRNRTDSSAEEDWAMAALTCGAGDCGIAVQLCSPGVFSLPIS